MTWTYGSPPVRIYVQQHDKSQDEIIARLNPVGGGTILHDFGDNDPITRIEALVLTSGDAGLLEYFKGTSNELISPEGTLGNWILKSISTKRHDSVNHTFFDRPSVDTDVPLYTVNMELYDDN